MTHLRARLILSCVMGRLKSLASTTQYITLDKEFRIGNCFPLHAQIAIKNNKCYPPMSLSVLIYQSLYSHRPPTITWCIYQPVIHLSFFPFILCSVYWFVYLFVYLPLQYPSLLISVLNVCLLSSPFINHSLCPSFIPETRMVFFSNGWYPFTFLPDSCQK